MPLKLITILIMATAMLSGCHMTREHRRPVEVAGSVAYEEFKVKVPIFFDSKAASVTGDLKDGDYSYSVGAKDLSILSDEQFAAQLAKIFTEAAKAVSPLP